MSRGVLSVAAFEKPSGGATQAARRATPPRGTGCRAALLALLGLLAVGAAATPARAAAPERPNVIFILADDLGWTDLGCQGSAYYETPHLDRLAAEGLRFTHGYTAGPNCQPTRAALMSGQYGPRTGIYTVGGTNRFDTSARPLAPVENVTKLAPAKVTVAEAVRAAGYRTGMFGKWHLGEDPEHHPSAQGFDEAIVSMGTHYGFKTNPKAETQPNEYLADFLTDRAVDFLERHRDEPFFLYLPHFGVHSPYQAKPEWKAHFQDKPAAGGHHDPTYAAMIASVDESVGRILKTLDELGLAEKTLVIFSSDNGGVGGYERAGVRKAGDVTDNAPLRGGKGMLYEGGVRVPYLFRWKGVIPPGQTCDTPIHSVDLFPTLLELTGATPPKDQPLDGVSYLGLLQSGGKGSLSRDALYWHFPGYLGAGADSWRTLPVAAVRQGDWKLLEFMEDRRAELYNLRDDPGQQTDLAAELPEERDRLLEKLHAWQQDVGAKFPAARTADATPPAAKAKPGKRKRKAGKATAPTS